MKTSEYWKERFEQLNEALLNKGDEYYDNLEKEYRKALNQIELQINNWYIRVMKNNEINMAQAKKLLTEKELEEFKWTVEEYIQYGKDNALGQAWMKELENASARVHIRRLEALEIQLRQTVEKLYQRQYEGLNSTLRSIYEDGYYHTAFEIQRGFNVGWTIPALDSRQVEKVLSKPWTADGSNFSDRIWKAKADLVNTLHTELTQSIIMGKAPDKAIAKIAKKFNVSKSRAGNLVMTESAFFSSASRQDCYNDLDVERYEVFATLDKRTSEICREMDGKVFLLSEYKPGLTANPFHCRCRTTTVPYFDDNYGERIARGEDGRQYYVPDNMTYKEWYKEYVKNNISSTVNHDIIMQTEEEIRERIRSDSTNKLLNKGAQQKHIRGSSRYIDGRSYLTISEEEAQELVNQYAGTGTLEFNRKGEFNNKELIVLDKSIGVNLNKDTHETETNRFYIHYGVKGTHIVPTMKGES